MMGKRDRVVVELEGVCVGKSDGKHHEKLLRVETCKNLKDGVDRERESKETCGSEISVERNSRTGMAMCTVAVILLKSDNTYNKNSFMI
jgi:hypothetical protein